MMKNLFFFLSLFLISQNVRSQNFSPQLEEAIEFCGGLQSLTDGLCPLQGSVDDSTLNRDFLPAKNIKLCSAKDTPGLTNPTKLWTNTKLKNIKLNLHYNSTSGRYGFGGGPFLIQVNFDAPQDAPAMVGRAVGLLPELPRKESFEKDICNPFLKNACRVAKGGNRCPLTQGGDVNYVATMPFTGSYRRGLPVDLRFELYAAPEPQADCVTKENLSQFGEPFICFIIQGYIL